MKCESWLQAARDLVLVERDRASLRGEAGPRAWRIAAGVDVGPGLRPDPYDPCQFQRQQRRGSQCRCDAQRQHPVWDSRRRGAYGYGTVFSVPLSGGSATVLASFNGNNGDGPQAGLTLSGNTLYGTTFAGSNGDGEVFSVPLSGGSATVLASFNGSNGDGPQAGLTLIGNTLYGTTLHGGANNDGTVFSVPLSGGSATVLVSFNVSNGYEPDAGLTVSGNALYGTTAGGGAMGTARSSAFP